MLADFQICINVLLSEVFFLQNVVKTKDEFLSKKLTSTINNKTNSKKNIYILREKKKTGITETFKCNNILFSTRRYVANIYEKVKDFANVRSSRP